jgi:DNA ligase-1
MKPVSPNLSPDMSPDMSPDLARRRWLLLLGSALTPVLPPLAFARDQASADSGNLPPALPLAQHYHDDIDPAPYLVSEKLDGVRAVWDGQHLRFRSGRLIHAPGWFTALLPKQALDGELWLGRGRFEPLSACVRRQQPQDTEWKNVSYQLYELPNGTGSFAERIAQLQTLVAEAGVAWLHVLEQVRLADRAALQSKLQQVVRAGGEGLVLHRADAPWETGRTDALLKLKPQHDAEATVIGHEAGHGKYQGLLGALLVQTPDGLRFRLGSGLSDAQRRQPPALGSVVTYRYRDVTSSGLPRFATFVRVRESE